MAMKKAWVLIVTLTLVMGTAVAWGAYHHGGDTDSDVVGTVYPDTRDTKLDSCALCHTGGEYEKRPGKWVTLGSCQWCHHEYGYDASGDIDATLNQYGRDYRDNGQNMDALLTIENLDSDGDTYSNGDEIAANRFPGDANDDPAKVPAPYRVYSRETLETLPQHTQFMLMNTHKSGDFYAQYGGVTMSDLLDDAGILPEAEGIRVFAPDGWSQYHPLAPDDDPLFYHVYGTYPQATFHYDVTADEALTDTGWCDYEAPSNAGRSNGDIIEIDNGLQMLLAINREGQHLTSGELNEDNKLDGEGPFRVVPPQKIPGPPDQSSYLPEPDYLWPFDENADHNAGFATRSATIIKVDPLPPGTTDIDTGEAGWGYVDEKKIVVYGAIDPLPTIAEKFDALFSKVESLEEQSFKRRFSRRMLLWKIHTAEWLMAWEAFGPAKRVLEKNIMKRVDGCVLGDTPDRNDWIKDCQAQKQVYWAVNEILVLMDMLN
jgi:hypothetical protein